LTITPRSESPGLSVARTLLTVRSRSFVPCIEYRLGFVGTTRSLAADRALTVSTPRLGGVSRKIVSKAPNRSSSRSERNRL